MKLFPTRSKARTRQHGAAALEMAFLLTATIALLPATALFARVFYQYNIMKAATQDAASYIASLPAATITNLNASTTAVFTAQDMVHNAAAAANIFNHTGVGLGTVTCDGGSCGRDTVPTSVEVEVVFQVGDLDTSGYTGEWTNKLTRKWEVTARSSVPYRN